MISPWVFAGTSLLAAGLNLAFIVRAVLNNQELLRNHSLAGDLALHRISRGFIFVWAFVVFADLLRVIVGVAALEHVSSALYLLLFEPFGSVLVAVIGLRSFR